MTALCGTKSCPKRRLCARNPESGIRYTGSQAWAHFIFDPISGCADFLPKDARRERPTNVD